MTRIFQNQIQLEGCCLAFPPLACVFDPFWIVRLLFGVVKGWRRL